MTRHYKCPHCSHSSVDLLAHIHSNHPDRLHDFTCNGCNVEGFATPQQLASHRWQVHGERGRGRPVGAKARADRQSVEMIPLLEISAQGYVLYAHMVENFATYDGNGRVRQLRYEQDDGLVSRTVAMWLGFDGDATKVKWLLERLSHDGLLIRQTERAASQPSTKKTRLYAIEWTPLALQLLPDAVPKAVASRLRKEYPIHVAPPAAGVDDVLAELKTLRLELEAVRLENQRLQDEMAERDRILASRGQLVHTSNTPGVNWDVKRVMEAPPGSHHEG